MRVVCVESGIAFVRRRGACTFEAFGQGLEELGGLGKSFDRLGKPFAGGEILEGRGNI